MLEIAAGIKADFAMEMFMSFLKNPNLAQFRQSSYHFEQYLANALSQCQYPSDRLVEELLDISKKEPAGKFKRLVTLSMSIVAGKNSISSQSLSSVLKYINHNLEKMKSKCGISVDSDQTSTLDVLSNVLQWGIVKKDPISTKQCISTALTTLEQCPTLAPAVIESFRHLILVHEQIQIKVLNVLSEAECETGNKMIEAIGALSEWNRRTNLNNRIDQPWLR